VYLVLYIDDMLVASHDMSLIDKLKAHRCGGTLFLSQKSYIEKVLENNNLCNCKSIATPFASHFKLSLRQYPITEDEKEHMSHILYSNAVESLMYAMIYIRPNLAHVVSVVSRFMHNPGKEHWNVVVTPRPLPHRWYLLLAAL
jgi:hypothetical protein